MSLYRDDAAALQAKVEELEGELADARAHIQRLLGAAPERKAPNDSLVGAPLRHVDAVTIEGAVSDVGRAQMERVLRARLALTTTTDGGGLRARADGWLAAEGDKSFTLESAGDRSTLRLETSASALPVVVALGPVIGALSSLPFALWQMNLLHHFEPGEGIGVTLGVASACAVLGALITRTVAKRRALALERAHHGAWAALTEIATERRGVRVQIADPPSEAGAEDERAEPGELRDEASRTAR